MSWDMLRTRGIFSHYSIDGLGFNAVKNEVARPRYEMAILEDLHLFLDVH